MTEVDSDTYDLLSEQLKQCILPEFDREIGDQPLEPADFYTFVRGLNMNLQLLFDVISKKEQLLLDAYDGCDEKFRVNFILLLQQQTDSADAPFQTNDSTILTHLRHLRDKYYKTLWMNQAVRKECLKYYKNQLTADKWKRNIGAVYGFVHLNKVILNNTTVVGSVITWKKSFFICFRCIEILLGHHLMQTKCCSCYRLVCS